MLIITKCNITLYKKQIKFFKNTINYTFCFIYPKKRYINNKSIKTLKYFLPHLTLTYNIKNLLSN